MAIRDQKRQETVSWADRLTPEQKVLRRRVLYEEAITSKTTGVRDEDKPAAVREREREQRLMDQMNSFRQKIIGTAPSQNGENTPAPGSVSDAEILEYVELRRRTLPSVIDTQRPLQELLTEEGVFLDSFLDCPSMRPELVEKRLARIARELGRLATVERLQDLNTEQLRKRKYLTEENTLWSAVAAALGVSR